MARMVLMAEVGGVLVWGKQRLGCMDGVKLAFDSSGMTVETARKIGKSRDGHYCLVSRRRDAIGENCENWGNY